MGLMSFLKKQFIDVIQMDEMGADTLATQFAMEDQEIQSGAILVVRESQMALFVNEGKIADVFGPGTHKLTTQTLPLLTNLKNWDKLFQSPFKSDVYFFNNKLMLNAGWGTQQPITIRDKEFDMIRIRAFGKYTYRIKDISKFFSNISGAVKYYGRESGVEEQLRNLIVSGFSAFLGNAGVPFIDLAANQGILAEKLKESLKEQFDNYGLEVGQFTIENLNLPDELQKTLDKRISMGIVGDLNKYTQFQMAESIPDMAKAENSMGNLGAGMAMAGMMANVMQSSLSKTMDGAAGSGNTKEKETEEDFEKKLEKLKSMFDKELITEDEYKQKRTEILAKM